MLQSERLVSTSGKDPRAHDGRRRGRRGNDGLASFRRWAATGQFLCLLLVLLLVSTQAFSDVELAEPGNELYYDFAAVAGERLQIAGEARVDGDVHSNGEIHLSRGSVVDGDATAVGRIGPQGEVTGERTEGADPLTLPALDDAALRALADRVLPEDTTFDDDLVLDDVLLVEGDVRIRAGFTGTGTLISLGDISLDGITGANADANPIVGPDSFLSIIAFEDVRVGKERTLRAAVRAGRDVAVEKDVTFDGVIVADRRIDLDGGSVVTFRSPDVQAPTLVELSPADGALLGLAQPTLSAAFEDDLSGVDLSTLGVVLDGEDVTSLATLTDAGFLLEPEPLTDGPHGWEISVSDVAGNELTSAFGFVTDTVPPTVAITAPSEPRFINDPPAVAATFSDATTGVDPTSVGVEVDGADITATCTVDASGASCPAPELPEGTHTVTVRAADLVANLGEASFTFEFIIDREPPEITVLEPLDGETVDEEEITVRGTVRDEVGVAEVTVDGEPATFSEGTFSAPVTLEPGSNTITVAATDLVGNSGSISLTVTLRSDTTPPTVRITSPQDGVFLSESRPEVGVSFRDDDTGVDPGTLTLTADGQPVASDCNTGALGAQCRPTQDLAEGAVSLGARVADVAGNLGSAAVDVIVDTEGLEVTITSPQDGTATAGDQVVVTGVVDPEPVEVEVNGVQASLSGGGFSATVPLREGVNMVVALAIKENGRSGTGTIEVVRDTVAPVVRINSPADGFVSGDDSLAITGLVNDVIGDTTLPRVIVNGLEAPVSAGGFMLDDLTLVPGPNAIEAVATDAVGNSSSHTINVTFEPPVGPRIAVASGQGQRGLVNSTLEEPLVAVVTDDLGNPVAGRFIRFEVSRNSGTLRLKASGEPSRVLQVPTDGAGRASVLFTLGDTAGEGNNRVRATSVGVAGEVEFCASGLAALPDKILMVEGDNQRGQIGHPLAQPLKALVVDVNGNPLPGVDVTFEVTDGSGTLDTQTTLTKRTDAQGIARVVFTLGPETGINNHVVKATFPGFEGVPATFVASGLGPGDPGQTSLAGVLLDNGQTPIPDARVSIADTALETTTDSDGTFELNGVPVGFVTLLVDPTESPRPEAFPPLTFETITVAGQRNTIGQPILLPAVETESSKVVGGPEDVTLTMPGVPGLELTVFANSATFPDGSGTGLLSISQVHLDKVPMPPPSGTIFMPPAWTIQPAGVHFDPPARISIPNDGLPPGRVIDIFQFDHTFEEFINVGKGTVSDDGFVITSDPGFGITRSGWGGCGQPQPPPTCPSSCDDGNECTVDFCRDGTCRHEILFSDCDDGNECTTGDRCQDGQCEGDPVPRGTPCGGGNDDPKSCTVDFCDGEGNCLTGEPKPDGTPCDDMEFCTMPDQCMGGQCEGEPFEDEPCQPLMPDFDIQFGPYDIIIITIPKVVANADITADVTKTCCEEKEIKPALELSGSGPFEGELSETGGGIPVPVGGTLLRAIDRVICKRVLNKIPGVECEVGLDIAIDGVNIQGDLTIEDSDCEMTRQWDGGGSLSVLGFGLSGAVTVKISALEISGDLSGTDDISGVIEAGEDALLVTITDSGITVAGSIDLPGLPPFDLGHTFEPLGEAGPFRVGMPAIQKVCVPQ